MSNLIPSSQEPPGRESIIRNIPATASVNSATLADAMTAFTTPPTIAEAGADLAFAIESHIEHYFRATFHGDGVTIDPAFVRLNNGDQHPFANFALMRHDADHAALERAIEPLLETPAPIGVMLPAGRTDLIEILMARGFSDVEVEPAMAVDLEGLSSVEIPAGCELIEVDESGDGAWCDAMATGYEIPRSVADQVGPVAARREGVDRGIRHYALTREGRMVATSSVFMREGFAGVYCVATVAEERGKGLGACVTANPLKQACDRGYRTGVLQASAMGESVYRRLGFETYGALQMRLRLS